MMFQNILVFPLKIITCFKQPFSSLLSTIKCKVDPLDNLKKSYEFFAQIKEIYVKTKLQTLWHAIRVNLESPCTRFELESLRIVYGEDSKTIREWKTLKSGDLLCLFITEIEKEIIPYLEKNGDKIQIKIKVNEEIQEFVFWEFSRSSKRIEYSNCCFSTQEGCFLDYFPKSVRSINHLLYYKKSCFVIANFNKNTIMQETIIEGKNIKSSIIKTSYAPKLFFDTKDFKTPGVFKFTDFNISIKQFEKLQEVEIMTHKDYIFTKTLTLFFEATKKIQKIDFDVFVLDQQDTWGR